MPTGAPRARSSTACSRGCTTCGTGELRRPTGKRGTARVCCCRCPRGSPAWRWSSCATSPPGRRSRTRAAPRGSSRSSGARFPSSPTPSARARSRRCRASSSCSFAAATRPPPSEPAAAPRGHRAPISPRSRFGRSPTRRSARPRSSRAFYPDLSDPDARCPVRDLPPALLDEHGSVLGARTAVPPALPQRRDQRDPGQRQLDARPRGQLRLRGRRAAPPGDRRVRLRLRHARQRARAARPARPRRAPRADDARAGGVGGQRRSSPPRLRDFYRYHSLLVEPWDGPAGLVFTDGRVVGAGLDRNGLRPLRYAVCADGLVVCCSEAGAVDLPGGARCSAGGSARARSSPSTPSTGSRRTRRSSVSSPAPPLRPLARRRAAAGSQRHARRAARGRPDRAPGRASATRART